MEPEYHRQKSREHYLKYKSTYDAQWKAKRARGRQIINEAKKVGCSRCSEKDPIALDFHHVKGKDYAVSELLAFSAEKINKEISKCIVLCSNCHRKEHAKRKKPG